MHIFVCICVLIYVCIMCISVFMYISVYAHMYLPESVGARPKQSRVIRTQYELIHKVAKLIA